jgi:hypothetical protein
MINGYSCRQLLRKVELQSLIFRYSIPGYVNKLNSACGMAKAAKYAELT